MANAKDVLYSIRSIQDTMKITNAMYLVSSSKLRRARKNLPAIYDYFETMQNTIHDILCCMPELEHIYLKDHIDDPQSRRAYVVITADKGLAGIYNQAIIKLTETELRHYPNARLYVVGQVGRRYFTKKTDRADETFLYSAQDPSLQRARNIMMDLLNLYRGDQIDEVFVIYTEMITQLHIEPRILKILPLDRAEFITTKQENRPHMADFFPSAATVMSKVAPIYMSGMLFGALNESYCAELSARMTAMDSATKNATDMIQELRLLYNRSRQAAITQEITEVVGGAKAFKQKKAGKGESL
ncbi:MAG: ATP synthase F1 subunit gamma [Evtepia sp.]